MSGSGRGAITGTVVIKCAGNMPLPEAIVSIFYGTLTTPYTTGHTDFHGVFNLQPMLSGAAKLSISYIGLETLNTDIHIYDSYEATNLGTPYMSSGGE